ncbi:MAG TPA: S16 family serine protease [Methylomirabilota bacterium]|nr:S16 family serine protease [Methylomirabilota bacterium]
MTAHRLTGFLAGPYARQSPLALSASSAELYALLSSLSGIPLTQSLAVTGSVNQQGGIQPVGAINEKIEGFFDVYRARRLDGRHGVVIPEGNARHLMLREDLVQAVREERFHVYVVSTVDEGLSMLSGRPAGERGPDGQFPADSVNGAVERALTENVARLRLMRGDGRTVSATKGERS